MGKINIAELLKDCPKGMELDCTMYDNCTFDGLEEYLYPIKVQTPDGQISLNKYGCYSSNKHAKCIIYPKGKTTWEEFVPPCKFKAGDIIKHKDSGLYCTLGEYAEGISAYHTNIGLAINYKDLEQWELVPNKFDITTLKPFESRVLVRDIVETIWLPCFFGGLSNDNNYPYRVIGGELWKYCIPYEGNQHLLGTMNDCDEFYKNW